MYMHAHAHMSILLFELQRNFDENLSCTNFVLQDGEVEGYWGNEHIFNRFPIFFYICFFVPLLYKDGVLKSNAHLIFLKRRLELHAGNEWDRPGLALCLTPFQKLKSVGWSHVNMAAEV